MHKSAATKGHDRRFGRETLVEDVPQRVGFVLAKARLAFFAKDLRNRAAHAGDDDVVEVDERPLQPPRQGCADRGFSGAHEPDKKNSPDSSRAIS